MKRAKTIEEKNAKIIEEYISGLPTLKPRTVKKYRTKLPIIAARIAKQTGKSLDKITDKELREYIKNLEADPDYTPNTR